MAEQIKSLMADLNRVCQAVTEEKALQNLIAFKDVWGKQEMRGKLGHLLSKGMMRDQAQKRLGLRKSLTD